MKITIQATAVIAAIFAIICFGVALYLFQSAPEIADATAAADTRGFAWFWAFLGAIAAVCGAAAWWILRSASREAPR